MSRAYAVRTLLVLSTAVSIACTESVEAGTRHTCATGGMVVTACPVASAVGRRILERGGNAVDAAIAVGFALAVTYPTAGNIGGGGFLLVRLHTEETGFIDFREKAPLAATRDMYLDAAGNVVEERSVTGHLAAGVPGSVAGLYEAHKRYATMSWEVLLEPAVNLARDGFAISERLAGSLEGLQPYLERFPALRQFTRGDGSPLRAEETLRQPVLARTIDRIRAEGPSDFYRGETAGLILAESKRGGGLITAEDLSAYRAVYREPVRGSYRGYGIISAPPPSSGGTVLIEILNILEGYDVGAYGFLSPEVVHIMVEAEKRAYYDRSTFLGDPDFVKIPVNNLISKGYAVDIRKFIGESATPASEVQQAGYHVIEHEETTHYSIVDRWGNAATVTTTLNGSYGSKVVVGGAGFLLNNEMDDFSVKPGVPNMYGLTGGTANAIEPGKRMLSSMTPTILERDGGLFLVLGTPGGSTIITTVAQIIVDVLDFNMSIEDAVAAPRFHHQWLPDRITYEMGAFGKELIDDLSCRGHGLAVRKTSIGNAQVIRTDGSRLCGASDPRGYGTAEGIDAPNGSGR